MLENATGPLINLESMKMFDRTETGVPSFETEWRNRAEAEEPTGVNARSWPAPEQSNAEFAQFETNWRGFGGYDSPLAG